MVTDKDDVERMSEGDALARARRVWGPLAVTDVVRVGEVLPDEDGVSGPSMLDLPRMAREDHYMIGFRRSAQACWFRSGSSFEDAFTKHDEALAFWRDENPALQQHWAPILKSLAGRHVFCLFAHTACAEERLGGEEAVVEVLDASSFRVAARQWDFGEKAWRDPFWWSLREVEVWRGLGAGLFSRAFNQGAFNVPSAT